MNALRKILLFGACLLLLGTGCATTGPPIEPNPVVPFPNPPGVSADQPETYEAPPDLRVPQVLDPGEEASPHHNVRDTVHNDGYLHNITIQSASGPEYPAYGVERARIRIHEVAVTAELEAMRKSEAGGRGLGAGLKSAALGPFKQVQRILRNPLYAVAAVPGTIFKYADLAVTVAGALRNGVGKEEFKELIGYDDAREGLARQLEIDPYTTNTALRENLDQTAWAFYSGGLPVQLVEDFIPGVPKLSLGTGGMSIASAIDRVRPSSRSRALRRMLPNKEQREAFRDHPWYTPDTERRLLNAMRIVDEVEGAGTFLLAAMSAESEDQAWAFMRTAELIEHYAENESLPTALHMAGPFPVLRDPDDRRALLLYADYVPWTQEFAQLIDALREKLPAPLGTISSTGTFSPRARNELQQRGLVVFEHMLQEEAD